MVESTSQLDTRLVFVLHDGIGNSVFEGQVLAPLIKKLTLHPTLRITLISFELKLPSQTTLSSLPTHDRLQIKIESRFRFWGQWALLPCAWRLKSFLGKFDGYELMARGPLAGWIALHAQTAACKKLTIQARGLAAEEYAYTHNSFFARLRSWQYKQLERFVFKIHDQKIIIETVSTALKDFLIHQYHTSENQLVIAQEDIPLTITKEQIQAWRIQTRAQLAIPDEALVYCYNGSAKPWQCPQETITYFKKQSIQNPQAVLLVLTRDTQQFETLCKKNDIPHYRICSVPYAQIYQYLSAADIGLLFREKHILNWVSRPTKALEYRAVGLKILHNGTVGMLTNKC